MLRVHSTRFSRGLQVDVLCPRQASKFRADLVLKAIAAEDVVALGMTGQAQQRSHAFG